MLSSEQVAHYRRHGYVVARGLVTDAEVALRQSEFNMARAAHDLLASRAMLDLAIGRVSPVDGEAATDPKETE